MTEKNIQFVFKLLAAAGGVERRLTRVLSNVKGISFTEYNLLSQLQTLHGGSATRVDLARAVQLTPSAVTRALKPLEKVGYVATQKGERDARQSVATLTPAGEELLKDASGLVRDELAALSIPSAAAEKFIPVLDDLAAKH